MEYKSRHTQPFTVEHAALLETPVITAEIARLQNSLEHLRDTQQQLQENVESEENSDPVILEALEENRVVISSQEERVSMLRLALELKGLARHTNTHYDPPHPSDPPAESLRNVASPTETQRSRSDSASESDGVFL